MRDVCNIYDNNISPMLIMIIIKIIILYFIQITHTDDFPPTGTHPASYDNLLRTIEGRPEGKRGRGRPRRTWVDDLRDWTGFETIQANKERSGRETLATHYSERNNECMNMYVCILFGGIH